MWMFRAVPRLVSRLRVNSWLTGRVLLSCCSDRTRQQPWGSVSGPLKFTTWQTGGSRDFSKNPGNSWWTGVLLWPEKQCLNGMQCVPSSALVASVEDWRSSQWAAAGMSLSATNPLCLHLFALSGTGRRNPPLPLCSYRKVNMILVIQLNMLLTID